MSHAMSARRPSREHPDPDVLARFIQGRLDAAAMGEIERHVGRCEACCRALLAAPEDRLTRLLRRPARP